jgi:predicted MFS family arabinose efflux permease
LVGIGLARFAYTPLIPPLIEAHWFAASSVVNLGAANLAGYLLGALFCRSVAARVGNVPALRASMLAVTAAFLACAFPLSEGWFFSWRLLSGVAGGAIMVLVASTLLPHVPAARRGLASGAIFLGLGMGIAGSGTLVPLLLELGLRETWIGLAAISALVTGVSWFAWPQAGPEAHGAATAQTQQRGTSSAGMGRFYVQYGLMAVGLVPAMVFLVDFVARGLHAGNRVGALFWLLYGLGAMLGPPSYGQLGDNLGARGALKIALGLQFLAIGGLYVLHSLIVLAFMAVLIGSFPPGIVPLAIARVRELDPHSPARQHAAWSRATTVFAASQALAGYAFSALFNASGGDHRLLFLISAGSIAMSFALNFKQVAVQVDDHDASMPKA